MYSRIALVREDAGLNQEAFAERIGVTKSAISGYETGRRKPTDQTIKSICREFGINEIWMRSGVGEMKTPKPNGLIEQLIAEYDCTKFEGEFLKTYFQMTQEERMVYVQSVYRILAPLMRVMDKKNPFADYQTATYGIQTEATAEVQKGVDEMSPEELHAELDRQLDIEKEATVKSEVS